MRTWWLVSCGAAVLGAMALGFSLAWLRDIRVADPAVQGASVGAIAGVAGGILGASITAWTTGRAAERTLRDAQTARFADRERELAARMLDFGWSHLFSVDANHGPRQEHGQTSWSDIDEFGRWAQELSLLVTTQESFIAIKRLQDVVAAATYFAAFTDRLPEDERATNLKLWMGYSRAYLQEARVFENAIRVELGRPPIDRSVRVPPVEPLADHTQTPGDLPSPTMHPGIVSSPDREKHGVVE
jgi:hypothetical protein